MRPVGLPRWRAALAVVAHPDDESFGLGAVLSTLAERGTAVSVLCLTQGEASTLHGVAGELAALRAREVAQAAEVLGLAGVTLRAYPDGGLTGVSLDVLSAEVQEAARAANIDGIVAFDSSGVTGHPDHTRATQAALAAAQTLRLPVLAWTVPVTVADVLNVEFDVAFTGHRPEDINVIVPVHRVRQLRAVACPASQAVPGSVLWRRLDLLAGEEHLRWLTAPQGQQAEADHGMTRAPAPAAT